MIDDMEMGNSGHTDDDEVMDLKQYRRIVKQFIDMRRYKTALFWAEKICVLNQNDPKDLYTLAHCMFLLEEYHRAAHTIRLHELEKTNVACYNLLLESLYKAEEFQQAVAIINSVDIELLAMSLINQPQDSGGSSMEEMAKNEMLASINYLKGKIFEALDNRGMAMDYYVQSLHKSVYCYEALEALVEHEMLMAWEEKELLQHLPLAQQSSESDAKFIKKLYESKLKKYYDSLGPLTTSGELPMGNLIKLKTIQEVTDRIEQNRKCEASLHKSSITKILPTLNPNITSPAIKILEDLKNSISHSPFTFNASLMRSSQANDSLHRRSHTETPNHRSIREGDHQGCISLSVGLARIRNSTDLMAAKAEKLFYDSEYKKCLNVLNELLKIDPYHKVGRTVQIGCLVESGDYNKLFFVAHKLVDQYPDNALSWYAVGCYYDLIGKSDPARRYLSKATSLDRLYGPAWLAYGHSFAKENEHDQAMAAYFKATQLMRGCHLPLLYIGVECGLTKNLELAEKFFYQAMTIAPLDVFVLHELGVIKYEYEQYESAEEVFRATMEIVSNRAKQNNEAVSPRWEPLYNNLGHCCRKTKKYEEALKHHQYALFLKPQSSQTLTCIGFIHSLMGNLEDAITYFHKSLAINRDCIVTSTILKYCIEDFSAEDRIVDEILENLRPINAMSAKAASLVTSTSALLSGEKLSTFDSSQRLATIDESPIQLSCMKLKFDDDDMSMSLTSNEQIDSNVAMVTNDD